MTRTPRHAPTSSAPSLAPRFEPDAPDQGGWTALGPWLVLVAVAVWGCWEWRPELTAVPYLDDSSVHQQMVRFATHQFQSGQLPLTSWFPYLGLGSPQFLHYQSLPAMLTGLLGMAIDPNSAFRWTLYLLLALWPLCVYGSARLFGLSRWTSAMGAAAAPLVMSITGIGYEPKAYIWVGYGVWAQLWASWTLPLAWAFTWRAMTSRRAVFPAVVFVSLTVALHFETGYLALIPIGILPFLCPSELRGRLARAALVALGSLLASAWVTVPLIVEGRWAATNEVFVHSPLVNGYGAKQTLSWLVSGQIYDAGRLLPVITVLAAIGLLVCVVSWRRSPTGRAVVVLWAMSLILSFGRTTLGPLTDALPGGKDLFMRRFIIGADLAGLLLAGIGAVAVARMAGVAVSRWLPSLLPMKASGFRPVVFAVVGVVVGVAALSPAWSQIDTYAAQNSRGIAIQHAADGTYGSQVDALISYVQAHGRGRVYAGLPQNWGSNFTVGPVPVFKYLESRDVDEVGYTLRTASLMTDPENFFDENNPGDYSLFGVHYLLLPVDHPAPVPAKLIMSAGPYRLWVLPTSGYVQVVDTVGVLVADRTNVGERSVPYLQSSLPGAGRYLTVAFGGSNAAPITAPGGPTGAGPAGTVHSEHDNLADGVVTATIVAKRSAAVVLSSSFDPEWTVTVDGHRATTEMLAPAVVGVPVSPGVHKIVFSYVGFSFYPELLALTLAALIGSAWIAFRTGRRAPTPRRAGPDSPDRLGSTSGGAFPDDAPWQGRH